MSVDRQQPVLGPIRQHLVAYPTPVTLHWSWSWGSLAGVCLSSQVITGIMIAMHYTAHAQVAFASVQHLMVDVPAGAIWRYTHAVGASVFFICVYVHLIRGADVGERCRRMRAAHSLGRKCPIGGSTGMLVALVGPSPSRDGP